MERLSILGDLIRMATREGRWVLIPAFVMIVVIGGMLFVLQASPLAPFLYPLF